MNYSAEYQIAVQLIDQANRQDPNTDQWNGQNYPKELLYSNRMVAWLDKIDPDANELLKLAVRAQHICRWMLPRNSYPKTRVGYLEWRTRLYTFHAEKTAEIMLQCGYDNESIAKVKRLIRKRGLKKDPQAQTLEDVACLVFLEHYFAEFIDDYADQEKTVSIVQKTWKKMSESARQWALGIELTENAQQLVQQALADTEAD